MAKKKKVTRREQKYEDQKIRYRIIHHYLDYWTGFSRSSLIPYAETGRVQGEIIGQVDKALTEYGEYAIIHERKKTKKLITKEVLKELQNLNLNHDKDVISNLYLRIEELKQE